MPFPFTFNLSVPGLQNPFSAPSQIGSRNDKKDVEPQAIRRIAALPPHRISPSPSLSAPLPLSRKRGWTPSTPEPSRASTNATSTRGYLDTPAKYRDMAHEAPERETEDLIAELPPAKRRRTLAGSIVSTALSAALIGTAVGLTVYRLWRDRGKEAERLPPPPPYQQGDWVPSQPKHIEVTPPTPKPRRHRHTPATAATPAARRSAPRHRRSRTRTRPITPPHSSPPHTFSSPQPEFDFTPVADEQEAETDEMDWIGDKLSKLIEEGQKALGREVVVMSDAQEDMVDDGTDAWVEEDQCVPGPSTSRHGSLHRPRKPRNIPLPPSYAVLSAPPLSASPRKARFDGNAAQYSPGRTPHTGLPTPSTPRRTGRGVSVESETFATFSSSYKEDESAWESPEIRESMERARAQYLQNRK
ncbi:hypothetical protein BJ138DRAFT_1009114 [Hygrophoropsis aurantiaca]|uniref:Uncharacterized protein n=1 Tax=Hygrophoropsis aurantiaca TaxID=72124 RepID=A0ACB8AC05_9AGAM|nr:hypothetical protein BJ138DRAFT_1009114 [Hygrophoropsis aurantiaca]